MYTHTHTYIHVKLIHFVLQQNTFCNTTLQSNYTLIQTVVWVEIQLVIAPFLNITFTEKQSCFRPSVK